MASIWSVSLCLHHVMWYHQHPCLTSSLFWRQNNEFCVNVNHLLMRGLIRVILWTFIKGSNLWPQWPSDNQNCRQKCENTLNFMKNCSVFDGTWTYGKVLKLTCVILWRTWYVLRSEEAAEYMFKEYWNPKCKIIWQKHPYISLHSWERDFKLNTTVNK